MNPPQPIAPLRAFPLLWTLVLCSLSAGSVACGDPRGPAGPEIWQAALLEQDGGVREDHTPPPERLAMIQTLVFDRACSAAGCHDTGTRAGHLDLSSLEASRDGLLGTDGGGVPVANAVASENGWLRVKPGDPDRSFLIRKLRLPGAGEGAPMPLGPEQITAAYLAQIAGWIEAGAAP